MKSKLGINYTVVVRVTSYAEVWIEIWYYLWEILDTHVTSYAEVWIEIHLSVPHCEILASPPTRRCGLKFFFITRLYDRVYRHLLRGGVD